MNDFLIEETEYNPKWNKTYEGIMAQGNGYLHVRGSFEEGLEDAPQNEVYTRTMKSVTTEVQRSPLSKCGTYIPLIMGNHPVLGEVIINLPFFMDISIRADGEKIDMIRSKILKYRRSLDMKNGLLTRSVTVETKSGCQLEIVWERFASMESKHLFVQKVNCRVLRGTPKIEWSSGIKADVTTNGYCHFQNITVAQEDDVLTCFTETDTDFRVMMKSAFQFGHGSQNKTVKKSSNQISYLWEKDLTAGESFSFCKFSVFGSSRDCDHVLIDQVLKNAERKGYEALLAENTASWEELWGNADVQIQGDDQLQKGLRFSIYHLLRSNTGYDDRTQVCAKGFAGEAYYGRYFWDSEVYLLPFYLYTNPKSALSLIMYRYHTLDGARRNAARYHCRGARYPWHSGLTGEEQCSLWEYADNEVHITADVAFAVMHYYRATDDYDFIQNYGLEILLETARFWMDRIDRYSNGEIHLLNVMGPDEYSPMTKDNAFTNSMVKYNLNSAVEMAELIRKRNPESYAGLVRKINFQESELESFKQAAELLPIPYDPERDLYLQSADFEDYAAIDMDGLWKDRNRPFGFFATQEKIYRSKCLKQADILALMMLFPQRFSDHQVEVAYDYYKPLTTHDSSLSTVVHAIIANRIGRSEDLGRFMADAAAKDLDIQERGAEDGIHIANCGCIWQVMLTSLCGVSFAYNSEEFTVKPNLPPNITRISFHIFWHGAQKEVIVSRDNVEMR